MPRNGLHDIWNGYMAQGAKFSSNDIPFCPTTSVCLPTDIVTWEEAKRIYKEHRIKKDLDFKYKSYVCFYIDDYKFDGPRGVWHDSKFLLKVLCHFEGAITVDFSTYQDFPEPIKLYATYRMRLLGYWLGKNGIAIINNVRWGTPETYWYSFDGIPTHSIVAIGTVGGSPRKYKDRKRFEDGLFEMVKVLKPHTIIVYGSANYPCFDKIKEQGIKIISYPSKTCRFYKERGAKWANL